MLKTSRLTIATLVFGLIMCAASGMVSAEDDLAGVGGSPAGQGVAPLSLFDAAFAQHVDMQTLTSGYASLDAAMLTDAALQLREGERILLRPHRAATADEIFGLAIDAAADSRDTATLDRLDRAFARDGRTELAGRLKQARLLAGNSRAVDPATLVDATTTDAEGFRLFAACQRDLKAARMTADGRVLGAMQEALPLMPYLTDSQKEYLLQHARAPIADRREQGPSLGGRLRFLTATSRCIDGEECEVPSWNELERLAGVSRDAKVRQAAAAAFEKLRAVSRFCDILAAENCF